ncbi:MAG: HlyD family efflux transporter periplasmic adaptor subunit [Bacteroidetes bacterium]|jgi:multidrug resistance efflux pump|nr:HlyD family efflux transporter periplasmic adaptor subunit [Bacteroidota bacterium]
MEEIEDDINSRSESIQDIIGTNPPAIVRWGNTFMFIICVTLISLCWVIKYPDTILSPVTIKTSVNPKPVTAKFDGKLIKLLIKDGDIVKRGQHLGYVEALANVEDIEALETNLTKIDSLLIHGQWDVIKSINFIKFNRFGEIQSSFETFFISLQTLQAYWNGSIITGKKQLIQNEIKTISNLNLNLVEQEREVKKDLKLAEDEYKTNLNLFFDNVIALAELQKIESKYISKKLLYKQLQSNILNNNNNQFSTTKQLVDINDNIEQEKLNFMKQLNILKNDISNWKHQFILSASDNGKISFAGSIEEYQAVAKGQDLFYVMPENIYYLGEVYLDQYNLGKVESGQTVIIKLKSYPFEEYGVVKGIIENISEIDVNKQYLVKVKLPEGITTNLKKKLKFRFGMLGDAEIITKNTKVIDKLIYKLKRVGG